MQNIFSVVPADIAKNYSDFTIYLQDDKLTSFEKAERIAEKLTDGITETLTYMDFSEKLGKFI